MDSKAITEMLPSQLDTVSSAQPFEEISSISSRPDQDDIRKIFQDRMKYNGKPVRHDKVAVLLLSWADDWDDLRTKEEIDALRKVFEADYGFHVETHRIGIEKDPQMLVNYELLDFALKHDMEHALLIIYYAGHGYSDAESRQLKLTGKLSLSAMHHLRRNSITWASAEQNIKCTAADVLVIFDCCHAGSLDKEYRTQTKRTFEFLGACAENEKTLKPGPTSFTSALIWALKELSGGHAFNTQDLLFKIKDAPEFPDEQSPQLFPRFEPTTEHIWIAPLSQNSKLSQDAIGTFRNISDEFVDLRLHFDGRVSNDDIRHMANALSHLIASSTFHFKPRHISLKRKSCPTEEAVQHFLQTVRKKRKTSHDTSISSRNKTPMLMSHNDIAPSCDLLQRSMMVREVGDPPAHERSILIPVTVNEDARGAIYHGRMFLLRSIENLQAMLSRWIRPNARVSITVQV